MKLSNMKTSYILCGLMLVFIVTVIILGPSKLFDGFANPKQPLSLYEFLSLAISLLGFIGVIGTIHVLSIQTEAAAKSAEAAARSAEGQTYSSVMASLAGIKAIFIQHPELRPYFYDNLLIKTDGQIYPLARGVAEQLLDYFDGILIQQRSQRLIWDDGLWKAWIRDMLSTSPILRQFLAENQSWYSAELYQFSLEANKTGDLQKTSESGAATRVA